MLSTLAVGQATAAANLRHSSFHARRAAEKREEKAVDWAGVTYDLKNVDWSKVDWSSVFNKETPAPTPTPEVQEPKIKEVQTSATPEPTSATPEVKPSSTKEAEPEKTSEASNPIEDITNDILSGLDSFIKKLGISKVGVNSKTENGGIWLGNSSPWTAEFTNTGGDDLKLFCWEAKGFSGMSLNVQQPAISINLAPGASQNISFAADVPSACAPAGSSTELANFGGIKNTWFEITCGQFGAFDISRNVWMEGTSISAQGSKCLSDMENCVFKCNSGDSCEKGYDLYNCDASSGGGGGYDPIMDGTGGGCAMGSDSEHIQISLS